MAASDRRGQVNILALTMIIAILFFIITITYLWAVPVIKKNSNLNDYNGLKGQFKALNELVKAAAEEKGQRSMVLEFKKGELLINDEENRIAYTVTDMYPGGLPPDWVSVNSNLQPYTIEIIPLSISAVGQKDTVLSNYSMSGAEVYLVSTTQVNVSGVTGNFAETARFLRNKIVYEVAKIDSSATTNNVVFYGPDLFSIVIRGEGDQGIVRERAIGGDTKFKTLFLELIYIYELSNERCTQIKIKPKELAILTPGRHNLFIAFEREYLNEINYGECKRILTREVSIAVNQE